MPVLRSDHAAGHTGINLQAGPCGPHSKELAIFLCSRLSNAVDARGVPVTNRFFNGDVFWFALQARAACDVIQLVIVIQGYGNRRGNLERIRSTRRILVVVRWQHQLPGGE